MKKLLLIMGDLATGKSTFARVLSERYGVNLFVKDTIKEILGDTVGFSNRAENLKLSQATGELMCFFVSEFGKLNKDLILESNFRLAELEKIHEIAAGYGYQVLTLVLHGDAEILHKRYLNRMNNENRHPVHLCTQFNTPEGFREYIESLRTDRIPGAVLTVNANDFSYQADLELLTKIDEFMQKGEKTLPF
jgi:predicted kinase